MVLNDKILKNFRGGSVREVSMNYKILLIVGMCFLIISSVGLYFIENGGDDMVEEERVFQGPVRPTDDEEHFRKTGETIPLEVEE